jgi:hypothetical protein
VRPVGEDTELRRLFHELRDREESQAPPFSALRSRPRAASSQVPRALFAAAAAIAVLLLFLVRTGPRAAGPTPSLADWTPPTDFLLRTAGDELMKENPALFERIPNYENGTPLKFEKGELR